MENYCSILHVIVFTIIVYFILFISQKQVTRHRMPIAKTVQVSSYSFFFFKLIPLFGTSGHVSPWVPSQSGPPYLHLTEVYMLHIPLDSPLVQHLPTSWWRAWLSSRLFSTYLQRHWWRTLNRLSYASCFLKINKKLLHLTPPNQR